MWISLGAHREYDMINFINTITDKSDWDKKVLEDAITSKWRSEVSEIFLTPKMMDLVRSSEANTELLEAICRHYCKGGLLMVCSAYKN